MRDDEITVVHGSGNIFADLNLPEPEELLAKAALGLRIHEAIVARGWTQVQAAAALGIPQPKVSALMGARLSGFSMERLLRLLLRLDQDIDIAVHPKREAQPRVRVA
jgi:predicted XRE-type DNA-binding protein